MAADRVVYGSVSITGLGTTRRWYDRVARNIETYLKVAVSKEAEFLAGKIKERLRTGPFKPLSALTLAARKLKKPAITGTKPLIGRGDLRNSVGTYPQGLALEKFVGVLRTAARRDGKDPVNIAKKMEFGDRFVLELTTKMRKFLFGVLLPKAGIKPGRDGKHGRSFIVIVIEPRPFIQPTLDEWLPSSEERMTESLRKQMAVRK